MLVRLSPSAKPPPMTNWLPAETQPGGPTWCSLLRFARPTARQCRPKAKAQRRRCPAQCPGMLNRRLPARMRRATGPSGDSENSLRWLIPGRGPGSCCDQQDQLGGYLARLALGTAQIDGWLMVDRVFAQQQGAGAVNRHGQRGAEGIGSCCLWPSASPPRPRWIASTAAESPASAGNGRAGRTPRHHCPQPRGLDPGRRLDGTAWCQLRELSLRGRTPCADSPPAGRRFNDRPSSICSAG